MNVKVATAPTAEPISLTEAKLHCRVDVSDDDALLLALITVARETIEARSWHALMTQTLELYVDKWWGWELKLPRPPLVSVSSITYKSDAGVTATWAASNYAVGANMLPGVIRLTADGQFPTTTLYAVEAIKVTYVAGWASAAAVPQSLKQAMLLLIGHWYENREAVIVGTITKAVEFSVDVLCMNYRRRAGG